MKDLNIEEIKEIRDSFVNFITYTPLESSSTFSDLSGNQVYLKLENFQKTGSFKIRGALYKLSQLSLEEKKLGVITASAGNHGQAVAFAAQLLNVKATIVVPVGTPIVKIEAIKHYQGDVIEFGHTYDDAFQKAIQIKDDENRAFIHAFNDIGIIKGQATVGLEIFEQLSDIDYIFCPIGGGGLISGISAYCKKMNPNIKIIGVQSEHAPSMYESFYNNKLTFKDVNESICEGIAIKYPGEITYKIIKKFVDQVVVVSDEEVANTILLLLERAKTFVEGAGAAALAAVIHNKVNLKDKKIVAVVSGGNLNPSLLNRIIAKGLINEGRLLRIKTKISDHPGSLLQLIKIIAEEKGNIVSIIHERERLKLEYQKAEVIIELEARGKTHISQILNRLKEHFEVEILEF